MNHKCNCCGEIHKELPKDARPWIDGGVQIGYFFECSCGSSLLILTLDKAKIPRYSVAQAQ